MLSLELHISFQSLSVSNAVTFCELSGNVFTVSPHTKTAPAWHTNAATAKSVHGRAEPSSSPAFQCPAVLLPPPQEKAWLPDVDGSQAVIDLRKP